MTSSKWIFEQISMLAIVCMSATAPAFGESASPVTINSFDTFECETSDVIFLPDSAVKRQSNKADWIAIPDWLAGTWQAHSEIILQAFDCRRRQSNIDQPVSVNISRTSVVGMQRDKSGRIWHCTETPYTRTIDLGSTLECQKIDGINFVNISPAEVIVTTTATVMHVDKQSGNLLEVFREQTLTTYNPLGEGLLQATFLINDYDMAGNPMFASKKVCTEKLTTPFKNVDSDRERGNLKASFTHYMMESGRRNLLP